VPLLTLLPPAVAVRSPWVAGTLCWLVASSALATPSDLGHAPAFLVQAGCDRGEVQPGEEVLFRLTVEHEASFEPQLPATLAVPEGLLVLAEGSRSRALEGAAERRLSERWWRLRAEQPGAYRLPSLAVAPPTGAPVTTSTVYLEVRTDADNRGAESEELRDIKPLEPPPGLPWGWFAAAGSTLLTGFALLFVRRAWLRQAEARRATARTPTPLPAEAALAALASLAEQNLGAQDVQRQACYALSQTLRRYVEDGYGLNATDLTTEEIGQRLAASRPFSHATGAELVRLLTQADRVKFGAAGANEPRLRELIARATHLVEATRGSDTRPPA
jgi:hypothetical protein